jgi:hypothetical protein
MERTRLCSRNRQHLRARREASPIPDLLSEAGDNTWQVGVITSCEMRTGQF